jgi:formiminoglutamase
MSSYSQPSSKIYTGRSSGQGLYLHEKISCVHIDELPENPAGQSCVLLGYRCDEGVRRNQGRPGAVDGPDAIRQQLGKLPHHLSESTAVFDAGNIDCANGALADAQESLTKAVAAVLNRKSFPIILGGGHDMAYGSYSGIRRHAGPSKSIGIINFDAHFDLRATDSENHPWSRNSGTPFYQIARDCQAQETAFRYLCLGIRKDANHRKLFEMAGKLGVEYLLREDFSLAYRERINARINAFIKNVDLVYMTIDMDGFSSAYAPGVSAPSPMGFSPEVVLESLKIILKSGKVCAADLAECNPEYDVDGQTAKLAASLIHFLIHTIP